MFSDIYLSVRHSHRTEGLRLTIDAKVVQAPTELLLSKVPVKPRLSDSHAVLHSSCALFNLRYPRYGSEILNWTTFSLLYRVSRIKMLPAGFGEFEATYSERSYIPSNLQSTLAIGSGFRILPMYRPRGGPMTLTAPCQSARSTIAALLT